MGKDERGTASWEFCLLAVPFFLSIFVIFDLARYAITIQSLQTLADTGARAEMINCYANDVVHNQSPVGCTGNPLTAVQMQNAAPFLYLGGYTVRLNTTAAVTNLTVTASSTFKMVMPIWGTKLNSPSASTTVPF